MKNILYTIFICGVISSLNASTFNETKKSCENGNPIKCFNLGVMYHGDMGTKKNYTKAIKFYKKAITLGEFWVAHHLKDTII